MAVSERAENRAEVKEIFGGKSRRDNTLTQDQRVQEAGKLKLKES